jgi:PadR family transcriptional regulator, regulatory protein PadR
MADVDRVTKPLLDVLDLLLQATLEDHDVHGWALAKATQRSGPTVYGVLDRLEDAAWVTGRWEEQDEQSNRPRRRLYRLTPTGIVRADALLAERRVAAKPVPRWGGTCAGEPA